MRPADPRAPFNYSHLVNLALPHNDTPLVLHLNNDVNALEPGWLEDMVGWITRPGVGAVGAKLIYPDRTLNHVGVIIGPHGGLAIGLERFTMQLLGLSNVKEATLFPRDRRRLEP